MPAAWKFKVVRRARDSRGEWFDYPTATTTVTEAEAIEYAVTWGRELRNAQTHIMIDVRKRGGVRGRGVTIATVTWDGLAYR